MTFTLSACFKYELQPEDVAIDDSEQRINVVVDGYISTEKDLHPLRLTKPSSWKNLTFQPISGATVTLFDGKTNFMYVESNKLGIYHSKDSIQGVLNRKYTVTIKIGNSIYTASDSIVAAPDFQATDFPLKDTKVNEDNYLNAAIANNNFGYAHPLAFYWSDGYVDSLGNYQIGKVNPFQRSWSFLHKGAIPQGIFPSSVRASYGFNGLLDDKVEFTGLSMSPNYYNYILSVKNGTDWNAGLFATVPGNSFTNLSEGASGYFFATDIKRKRFQYKEFLK